MKKILIMSLLLLILGNFQSLLAQEEETPNVLEKAREEYREKKEENAETESTGDEDSLEEELYKDDKKETETVKVEKKEVKEQVQKRKKRKTIFSTNLLNPFLGVGIPELVIPFYFQRELLPALSLCGQVQAGVRSSGGNEGMVLGFREGVVFTPIGRGIDTFAALFIKLTANQDFLFRTNTNHSFVYGTSIMIGYQPVFRNGFVVSVGVGVQMLYSNDGLYYDYFDYLNPEQADYDYSDSQYYSGYDYYLSNTAIYPEFEISIGYAF